MKRLVEVAILVHSSQRMGTTNSGPNAVTDLGQMDVLVELIWVGDTSGEHRLGSANQDEQGDRVDLLLHEVLALKVERGEVFAPGVELHPVGHPVPDQGGGPAADHEP